MTSSRVRSLFGPLCVPLLAAALAAPMGAQVAASAQVALDVATIHAATLTKARARGDTSDAPYLLVSVVRDAAHAASHHLPQGPHWTLTEDSAVPEEALTTLSLAPGDTVRLLLSLLEHEATTVDAASRAGAAATARMARATHPIEAPTGAMVSAALLPLTSHGAHWIGSATLLLINDAGTLIWREMGCVQTCSVVKYPANAANRSQPLTVGAAATAAVVELTGSAGTYHLQLTARRTA